MGMLRVLFYARHFFLNAAECRCGTFSYVLLFNKVAQRWFASLLTVCRYREIVLPVSVVSLFIFNVN